MMFRLSDRIPLWRYSNLDCHWLHPFMMPPGSRAVSSSRGKTPRDRLEWGSTQRLTTEHWLERMSSPRRSWPVKWLNRRSPPSGNRSVNWLNRWSSRREGSRCVIWLNWGSSPREPWSEKWTRNLVRPPKSQPRPEHGWSAWSSVNWSSPSVFKNRWREDRLFSRRRYFLHWGGTWWRWRSWCGWFNSTWCGTWCGTGACQTLVRSGRLTFNLWPY